MILELWKKKFFFWICKAPRWNQWCGNAKENVWGGVGTAGWQAGNMHRCKWHHRGEGGEIYLGNIGKIGEKTNLINFF